MTLPDNIQRWLRAAPLPAILALALSALGALASWTWVVASEVQEQKATVAVAAVQAQLAVTTTGRIEDKVDKLIDAVNDLRTEHALWDARKSAKPTKEKN